MGHIQQSHKIADEVFVGRYPWDITDDELINAINAHNTITSADEWLTVASFDDIRFRVGVNYVYSQADKIFTVMFYGQKILCPTDGEINARIHPDVTLGLRARIRGMVRRMYRDEIKAMQRELDALRQLTDKLTEAGE